MAMDISKINKDTVQLSQEFARAGIHMLDGISTHDLNNLNTREEQQKRKREMQAIYVAIQATHNHIAGLKQDIAQLLDKKGGLVKNLNFTRDIANRLEDIAQDSPDLSAEEGLSILAAEETAVIEEAQANIEEAQATIEKVSEDKATIIAAAQQHHEKAKVLEEKIVEAESHVGEDSLFTSIFATIGLAETAEQEVERLREQHRARKDAADTCLKQGEKLQCTIDDVQCRIDGFQDRIDHHTEIRDMITDRIEEIKGKGFTIADEIEAQTMRIEELHGQIENIDTDITTLEGEIEKLEEQLAEQQKETGQDQDGNDYDTLTPGGYDFALNKNSMDFKAAMAAGMDSAFDFLDGLSADQRRKVENNAMKNGDIAPEILAKNGAMPLKRDIPDPDPDICKCEHTTLRASPGSQITAAFNQKAPNIPDAPKPVLKPDDPALEPGIAPHTAS